MSDNIFKAPNDTSQQMADCLPSGRAWGLRNDPASNTRKLINCLSVVHNRAQQQIETLSDEFNIDETFDLLEDWEKSVGLPDQCIGLSQTIQDRRQDVIKRLKKMPIVTIADLQAYINALFPGLGVTLYPGYDYYSFEYEFEVPLLGGVSDKFIIVAEVQLSENIFEYEFEMEFEGGVDTTRLECLLNKILPACVYLIIEYAG